MNTCLRTTGFAVVNTQCCIAPNIRAHGRISRKNLIILSALTLSFLFRLLASAPSLSVIDPGCESERLSLSGLAFPVEVDIMLCVCTCAVSRRIGPTFFLSDHPKRHSKVNFTRLFSSSCVGKMELKLSVMEYCCYQRPLGPAGTQPLCLAYSKARYYQSPHCPWTSVSVQLAWGTPWFFILHTRGNAR